MASRWPTAPTTLCALALVACGGTPIAEQERIADAFTATSACDSPQGNPIDAEARDKVREAIAAFIETPGGQYEDKSVTSNPSSFRSVMGELRDRLQVCDPDLAAEVSDALVERDF